MRRLQLVIAGLLLLLPTVAQSQITIQFGAGTSARVMVIAPKVNDGKIPEIPLSGKLTLVLSVEAAGPLEVKEAKAADRLTAGNPWQATQIGAAKVTSPSPGQQRWELTLHVEPSLPGEQKLALAPLEYRMGKGDWKQVTWKEIPVLVTTTIAKPDKGATLAGSLNIEETPPAEAHNDLMPILAAAGGFAVVACLAVWLIRRRTKAPVVLVPPEKLALQELGRLGNELPAAVDDDGRFHTRLTNVVRSYLEARYQVPAPRQTASEFCDALARLERLSDKQLSLLRDFLGRCELPKYAPVRPSTDECLTTLSLARTFIEQSEPRNGHARISCQQKNGTVK